MLSPVDATISKCRYAIRLSWYQILLVAVGCTTLSFREGSIVCTMERTHETKQQHSRNDSNVASKAATVACNASECRPLINVRDEKTIQQFALPYDSINSVKSSDVYDDQHQRQCNPNKTFHSRLSVPDKVVKHRHSHRTRILRTSLPTGEESMLLRSEDQWAASFEYFEAMVHPSLLVHPSPQRIAVMHDISGRIVRQILKHVLVQEVLWIVPPSASLMVTPVAMEIKDPRINLIYTDDPLLYFQQSMTEKTTAARTNIDVVFVDASTNSNVTDQNFLNVVEAVLGECGMMVCHIGQAETMNDLPVSLLYGITEHKINDRNRWVVLVDVLRHKKEFRSIVDYNVDNEKFVVGMKCTQCRSNWIWNEAEFQIQIAKRIRQSGNRIQNSGGGSVGTYFDSSTMMTYQFPSRIVEEVLCRNDQDDDGHGGETSCMGHGYDPDIINVPLSSLIVNTSAVANGGRGVFTTQAIAKGSTIVLDACALRVMVPITTLDLLYTATENARLLNSSDFWAVVVDGFIDGYGWSNSFLGGAHIGGVETTISTFVNHGCNGSYNVGTKQDYHEMNIMDCDIQHREPCRTCSDTSYAMYDPFLERQYLIWECQQDVANRNIGVGEEILYDYMCMGGTDYLMLAIADLQNVCSGGIGFVSRYEDKVLV